MHKNFPRLLVISTLLLSALLSVSVAFVACVDRDRETFPTARSAIVVLDVPEHADLWRMVQTSADATHSNTYRVQLDPDSAGGRLVRAAVGNRESFDSVFRQGRHRAFADGQTSTLVRSSSTERGLYFSTMSRVQAEDLVRSMREAGVEVRLDSAGWDVSLAFTATRPGLVIGLVSTLFALLLLGQTRGLLVARHVALREVVGRRALARDLCGVLATAGGVAVVVGVMVATVSATPLVGGQMMPFLVISETLFLICAVVFASGIMTGSAVRAADRMRAAFSGWRPWQKAGLVRWAAQVAAVASVAFASVPIVSTVDLLDEYARSSPLVARCAACVPPLLSGTLRPEDIDAAAPRFTAMVNELDAADGLLLARHPSDPAPVSYAPETGNSVIVNSAFLQRFGSTGMPAGVDDTRDHPGAWSIFVPEGAAPSTGPLVDEWKAWFAFQREVDPDLVEADAPTVRTYEPQEVFDLGGETSATPLFAAAPVVVVVDARARLLSGDFYTAAASSGQLLIDTPDPRAAVERFGLSAVVGSFVPLVDVLASDRAVVVTSLLVNVAAGLLAVIGLITAVTLRICAYRWRSADRLRQSMVLGASFLSAHRSFIIPEAAAVIAVVGLTGVGSRLMITDPSGAEVIAALVAVTVGVLAIIIAVRPHNENGRRHGQ